MTGILAWRFKTTVCLSRERHIGRMKLFAQLFLSGLGLTITQPVHASDECLLILSSFTPMEQMFIPSLEAAFASNGICVNIEYAPPKRATVMLRKGQADGEMLKVGSYQADIGTAAFAVDEPLMTGFGLLVTQKTGPGSLHELRDQRIGAIAGYHWHLDILPQGADLVAIETYEAGLKMLENRRISGLLIDSVHFATHAAPDHGFNTLRVTPEISGYFYLHARHRHLSDPIAQIVKSWKADYFRHTTESRSR